MADDSGDSMDSMSDFDDDQPMIIDAQIICLFCNDKCPTIEASLDHCLVRHEFDIHRVKEKHALDYFGYIKLINYIRVKKPSPEDVLNAAEPLWDSDEYLQPANVNDPWLWYDLPGLRTPPGLEEKEPKYVNSEYGKVTLSHEHFTDLKAQIHDLTKKLKERDEQISKVKSLLNTNETRTVSSLSKCEDEGYFASYSNALIHHEMLSDVPRMEAYKSAILNNKSAFRGQTVLDMGCGTGILSLWAVQAGAKEVHAVDDSDIVYYAIDIVLANKLESKINIVKSKAEQANFGEDKFDVIVSEWMGYFLLFEGMLDSLVHCREHYLKAGGTILPSSCKLKIFGVDNPEGHDKMVGFWKDVHGFDFTSMKDLSLKEPTIEVVQAQHVITDMITVHHLDMYTCVGEDTNFESRFNLVATRDGNLTSLAGFFDAIFDLESTTVLSTSPFSPPTHWKHTVFYIKEPLPVKKHEKISVEIKCNRPAAYPRSLSIHFKINDRPIQKYLLV